MKFEQFEHTVPNWALSIIANADYSGCSEEDIKAFEAWEQSIKNAHGKDAQIIVGDNDLGFCHSNDVDDYAGDCHEVIILVPIEDMEE